jgi:hypothetical protein
LSRCVVAHLFEVSRGELTVPVSNQRQKILTR